MRQFLGIAIAFLIMPVLTKLPKKKLGFGPILLISATVLALVAGLPLEVTVSSLTRVFTTVSTVRIIVVVLVVGVLGAVLKKYDFMNKIVVAIQELIPNKKALIMTLPAVMGLLTVPGGAYLSAPFVDEIGKDLEMQPQRRAAVNLSFRHIAAFVLPTGSNMLFVSTVMPDINIYQLILLNIGFVLIMQSVAYFAYVRPAPKRRAVTSGKKGQALLDVAVYLSPVYMPVVFNAVFNTPMDQAVMLSVVWLLFICENQKRGMIFNAGLLGVVAVVTQLLPAPWSSYGVYGVVVAGLAVGLMVCNSRSEFIDVALKGINFGTLTMMVGVYFMQNVIRNLDQVMAMFSNLFLNASGFSVLIIVALASMLFGLTTGLALVPMGIILPLVAALPLDPATKLVYANFVYIWAFLGYYYSPLHLCQLLTVKYMECSNMEMYKEHLKAIPILAVGSFLLFYLYNFLLV